MRHEFDGMHWDSRKIRAAREYGWFRQHEAEIIEAARRRRAVLEEESHAAAVESRRLTHRYRCPKCGVETTGLSEMGGVEIGKCGSCGWIFVDRVELRRLLSKHRSGGQS